VGVFRLRFSTARKLFVGATLADGTSDRGKHFHKVIALHHCSLFQGRRQSAQPENAPGRIVHRNNRRNAMLLFLAIILVVAWLGGFAVFHVAGGLIHLLLLFAIASFVFHLIAGRSSAN
jgi:hypothetical protein